ncbi:rRNA maturation RNase YbeY [Methylovulum psychrotolerans]|jgi:probable rRNA maturation factor|uniref:Endoribonuclease YbeY n=1 Tax=Methylovulum psychrotolerans TaxID=1704499 RepID=A0A1Z4BV51_9GAMM|nr:rRNA maturation RNase YbeY [Methylovulum psychrotolerans]ASF45123.1 rRNA maturation RNase YbeY [Methylovulum psychrotolerans]
MNWLDVQRVFASDGQPDDASLQRWVDTALAALNEDTEIVVRIVGIEESAELNSYYRAKQGPTNILSFPFEAPDIDGFESALLGDLVVCAPVLAAEAEQQGKPLLDHWAHIIIHGVLHLLGYDHIDEADAEEMESKEIVFLQQLTIRNPYLQVTDHER